MRSILAKYSRWQRERRRRSGGHGSRFRPHLEALEERALLSVYTVDRLTDLGEGAGLAGDLRYCITQANAVPGDDTITFAVTGTINLTGALPNLNSNIDLQGPGADQLTVRRDTGGNYRIFTIGSGATVVLSGLTITNGLATQGAGISNVGSQLAVVDVVFSNNRAVNITGNGSGGAIDSRTDATLTVVRSQFLRNQSSGSAAQAGAISSAVRSTATVIDSTFIGNQALGGDNGNNGFARGGAIRTQGTLTVVNSTFVGNQALGGSNNTGSLNTLGAGVGGAILNADGGILFVTGSLFSGNQALGGANNTSTGASGNVGTGSGGGLVNGGEATVTDSTFEDNEARGGSGNRGGGTGFQFVGMGFGGGINTTAADPSGDPVRLTLDSVTLRHNRAVGGDGNMAGTVLGTGEGGGLFSIGANTLGLPSGGSTTLVSNSTIADNQAVGGDGSAGRGGGIATVFGSILTVSGSTLAGNQALGGAGGSGQGGGLFNDGPSTHPSNPGAPTILVVSGSTIAGNEAVGGAASAGGSSAGFGAGGGISSAGILVVFQSILADNVARGGAGAGGATGGHGQGGGLSVAGGTAIVFQTTISRNQAVGGDGVAGGNGFGGGIHVGAGTVIVVASEITDNQARGGDGEEAEGLGVGGGVYNLGLFVLDADTVIARNRASTSHDDCYGVPC
jgi:hypothetical protein